MIFSTTIFIFFFLPLFLIVYYLLPFRLRAGWLLAGSWIFYGWWRIDFLGLMILSTVWTYWLGRMLVRNKTRSPLLARILFITGIILNLGVLGYFKYFNFAMQSVNAFFRLLGLTGFSFWKVVLPIGISFYTFHAISYLFDLYRGDALPAGNFIEFASYISLFPQLVAGPILRYKQLAGQLRSREHTFRKFSEGATRFMSGFCRKVLIADTVGVLVNTIFTLDHPGFLDAWLGMLAYSIQLYFDFSGYSDMALGLGLMLGFRFMENFDRPYAAQSINEFWRRWHISLSSWLRDYLYIPLGGNRKGVHRTYINLVLVMLLGGLWHGAAWTFLLWGLWHGGFLALERFLLVKKGKLPWPPCLARLFTLLIVMCGWVIFRSADGGQLIAFFTGLAGLQGFAFSGRISWQLSGLSLAALGIGWLIVFREGRAGSGERQGLIASRGWFPAAIRLLLLPLFILGILKLMADSFSPFLYFQF